jgi:hypothetical protein
MRTTNQNDVDSLIIEAKKWHELLHGPRAEHVDCRFLNGSYPALTTNSLSFGRCNSDDSSQDQNGDIRHHYSLEANA